MIITADCDIDKKKGGSDLVYLPILNYDTYFREVWLAEERDRLLKICRDGLDKSLMSLSQNLGARHVIGWTQEFIQENHGKIEEILKSKLVEADQPKNNFSKEFPKIVNLVSAFHALTLLPAKDKQLSQSFKGQLTEFLSIRDTIIVTKGDSQQSRKTIVEQTLHSLQQRVDMWLIRDLIGLDPDMTDPAGFGFVVPLRSFSRINTSLIKLSRKEWYADKNSLFRLCRLRGIYKTDLLQSFANLFVRVGLDDERDDEHRRAFKRFADVTFSE